MYRWPICDHVYNEPIGLLCPECQWESTREDNGLGDSACGGGVAPELTNIMNSGVPDGNCLGLPTAYDMGHSRTQFHNSGNSFGPTRDKIMLQFQSRRSSKTLVTRPSSLLITETPSPGTPHSLNIPLVAQ
jgi:hypothetical protein